MWRAASGTLMLYLAAAVPGFWLQGRSLPRTTALNDAIGVGVSLLASVAFLLQLGNFFARPRAQRVGLYVAGLLVLLAISMVPFVRLVSNTPRRDEPSS